MKETEEYIHIQDAYKTYNLKPSEIIESFKQKQLPLYCHLNQNSIYGEGVFKGNKKASVIGQFDYNGIVEIPRNNIYDLLIKVQPSKVNKFIVKEAVKIVNWCDSRPANLDYPNSKYLEYKHTTVPEFPIYAFLNAVNGTKTEFIQNISNVLNAKFGPRIQELPEDERHEMMYSTNELKKTLDQKLSYEFKEFYPTDLRIKITDLSKLLKSSKKLVNKNNKRTSNPLNQLILDIFESEGGNSSDIWIALQQEAKKDILDRKFDLYGILEEVSHELILWRSPNGALKSIKRSSFRKKVSQIKSNYLSK